MAEFHFLRPWLLLLFIPLIVLIVRLYRRVSYQHNWQKICDPHLLPHLLKQMGKSQHYISLFLLALAVGLMIIALAGPSWSRLPQQAYQKRQATVVVLDLSPNMLAQDISPSRLSRAKFKVRDILKHLNEGQVGMVVFSGEPFVVSPLTEDGETITTMLPQLHPEILPIAGSNIGEALMMAGKLITQAGFSRGQIVLLTASEVSSKDKKIAKALASHSIRTSILAMATKAGAPIPIRRYGLEPEISRLDQSGLESLVSVGGGKYLGFTNDDNDIRQLFDRSVLLSGSKKSQQIQVADWQDNGRFFLYFSLPIFLLAFRRGWLESIKK